MPPAVGAAIAGGIASAGTSAVLGKVMGGGKSNGGGGGGGGGYPLGFITEDIKSGFKPGENRFAIATSGARKTLIQQIQESLRQRGDLARDYAPKFSGAYGEAITGTRGLLERVAPGVSEMRASRLQDLENARLAAQSNLTENLARRKVAGSSFANDTAARQNLAYQQEGDRIRAESFLQEIAMTDQFQTKLLEQELGQIDTELKNYMSAFQFDAAADQTQLDEQNYIAEIGRNLATGATNAAMSLRATELELAAQEAAGRGKFVGNLVGGIDFNSMFDKVFNGGGGNYGSVGSQGASSTYFPATGTTVNWN